MSKVAAAFVIAAFSFGWSSSSQAMPIAPLNLTAGELVVQIAGGCGRGWHRGPYGGCRRNYANPRAHACPRGFHIGPGGRCRGNGR